MSSIYDSRQRWKLGFIFAAVLIAMASVVVSDLLIKDLAREERQKIEVWSEATRVMTSENPSLNMNLILKIIQGNTSIPVILCSETDSVVSYNNIEIPEKNVAQFMTNKVKELRTKNPPIVIDMDLHIMNFVTATLRFQQHSEAGIFLDVDVCDGVHHDAELDHYSSPLAQIAKTHL